MKNKNARSASVLCFIHRLQTACRVTLLRRWRLIIMHTYVDAPDIGLMIFHLTTLAVAAAAAAATVTRRCVYI